MRRLRACLGALHGGTACLLLAIAAGLVFPARAQSQAVEDTLATLKGQVLSRARAEPLAKAFVFLTVSGEGAMTDEKGRFTLPDVPAVQDTIQIRYLGVDPSKTAVELQAGHITTVTLLVSQTVIEVADLEVEVRRLRTGKLGGFEERRRKGFGYFITPQRIQQRQPTLSSDMLRGVPGVTVGRTEFGRAPVTLQRGSAGACTPELLLDGQPMSGMTIDDVTSSDLLAIEIYRGATEMPAQWAKGSCGLLVVWTREGPLPEDS